MDISAKTMGQRLREERQRLGWTQSEASAAGGVKPRAQIYYESGERSADGIYWARMARSGVDIGYVLTGSRAGGAAGAKLSRGEEWMLRTWRGLTERQRAAWRELLGEPPAVHEDQAPPYGQPPDHDGAAPRVHEQRTKEDDPDPENDAQQPP